MYPALAWPSSIWRTHCLRSDENLRHQRASNIQRDIHWRLVVGHSRQGPGRRDHRSTALRIGQDTPDQCFGRQGRMATIYDAGEYQERDPATEFEARMGLSCPPPSPTERPREWRDPHHLAYGYKQSP